MDGTEWHGEGHVKRIKNSGGRDQGNAQKERSSTTRLNARFRFLKVQKCQK